MSDAFSNLFHNNYGVDGEKFIAKPPGAEYPMMYSGKPPLTWGQYEPGVMADTPEAVAEDKRKHDFHGSPADQAFIQQMQEQPEGSQITDEAWIGASKRLYHYMNPTSQAQTEELAKYNLTPISSESFTDEDYANWGVNFMSKFNYNITAMLFDVNKLSGAPSEVAASMYYMMETADRDGLLLENFKRGFSNFMTDPTTYVGLSTLGIGMVGTQSGKQLSKMAFKDVLKNIVVNRGGSAAAVAGVESMAYSGIDNAARQGVKINAGQQDEANVGETALSLASGFVLGNRLAAGLPAVGETVMRAAQAIPDVVSAVGDELTSGAMYSNPVGVVADAVGNVVTNASETVAVRSEGGLPIAQEKGDNNLRLHLMRLEKMNDSGAVYPGGPKNPRTVIQAPKGTDLPDIVVGNITPDDWQTRIEKSMSTEEIQKAANWYKVVFGEFQKQADGDPKEIARLTDAWFSGQQNSSPGQTLNDVLFVFEQIKRGVPKEKLRGKGLPSANRIVIDILTSSKIEGGAGQKIADFLDSGYEKNVRAIMGNKPEGGSPFVVDIHTARDTGLVDETYKNHLTRLGYDVPDGLIADVGGGGINGPQYENRALFGQQLTQHLNNQKWMGRSDWEAAEVQAIGWMQLSSMYGASNTGGDVVDAFTRNTRRISMEIDPGAGSPLAEKYGADFGALDLDAQRSINNEVTAKAIELVNKQTGITLGSNVHGTGGWELYQNPSTVQQAIASKDTAIEAAARLGYLMQQTEVWVNAPKTMTKNPKHFSIDIVETTGKSLREGKALTNLFDAIIAEEPNELFRGYQPIEIDGKPGIRILITDDAVKASPLTKAKAMAYIQEFANGKLGEITDRLNFDAEIDIMEADLTRLRNNWEEDKQGGGYKSYFSGQPRKDASAENSIDGVLNTDGAELERLFSQRIREAQGQRGGTSQVDSSASSNNGGGE